MTYWDVPPEDIPRLNMNAPSVERSHWKPTFTPRTWTPHCHPAPLRRTNNNTSSKRARGHVSRGGTTAEAVDTAPLALRSRPGSSDPAPAPARTHGASPAHFGGADRRHGHAGFGHLHRPQLLLSEAKVVTALTLRHHQGSKAPFHLDPHDPDKDICVIIDLEYERGKK